MTDKSTQNTFLKMKQWHTIEAAASLIVSDDVVKVEEWRDNAEIQETYKVLRNEASEAFRYSKLKISVHEAIEFIENSPYLAGSMREYPDLRREDLITAVERFFKREIAISHTVLRDVIKDDNLHAILEIQIQGVPARKEFFETCKYLLDDVFKVCSDSESLIKKDEIIEFIENHSFVNMTIKRYPDINHQLFITMVERVFEKALFEFTRTFNEIFDGLYSEYRVANTCKGIKDFERDIEYTPEYIKTAMEASFVIKALIVGADKFGLNPCFYPAEEVEPDYSRFYPISLKSDTPKGYLEVRTEGIGKLLEYYKIQSKFFNTVLEKLEDEIVDPSKSAFPSADGSEDQLIALINNSDNKYPQYTDRLTPVEYKTFEAYRKGISVEAIAERENVSETAIYNRINKARRKTGDYTDYRKRK